MQSRATAFLTRGNRTRSIMLQCRHLSSTDGILPPESSKKRRDDKTETHKAQEVESLLQQQREKLSKPVSRWTPREKPSSSLSPTETNKQQSESVSQKKVEAASLTSSDNKSLFDVFKIPDPPASRSETAFDAEAYKEYLEILEPIATKDPKFRRLHTSKPIPEEAASKVVEYLRAEEPVLEYGLPTFRDALKQGIEPAKSSDTSVSSSFADETKEQKRRFMEHMGFTEMQLKMAEGAIFQITNMCARKGRGQPLQVVWAKAKELGISYKKFLNNLLYVAATFSTGGRRKRTKYGRLVGASILDVLATDTPPDEDIDKESEDDAVDTTDEIAIYHDLLYTPNEQSISIRVRLLVAHGHSKEAERLLDEHAEDAVLRLRSYSPILKLYLEQGDVSSALKLYRRMRTMQSVYLEAETYVNLIAGVAERGFFQPSAPPIEGAKELGFSVESGPVLFDEIVSEMAKEIIEIPSASAKRLYNAFAEGSPDYNLEKTNSLAPLKVSDKPALDDELIVSRVSIDHSSGRCGRSGVKLRLLQLDEDQAEKLKNSILSLAKSDQLSFEEKMNTPKGRRTKRSADGLLSEFLTWLDKRDGEPFTCIVDGANVGYYMQNFEDGRFSYHQIKFVVDSLEKLHENPLVVLPKKYVYDKFAVTIGSGGSVGARYQRLTKEEAKIRDGLILSGKTVIVPPGHLDDFYWISASVSKQTNSRKGRDLYVKPGNPDNRWPGARPMLISNDQMRDHKIGLLEQMLFRRWYSNFIVNYNFAAFVDGECTHPEIGFSVADFFSREIQGNPTKGGLAWHFPIADADDEWFCVRIPSKRKRGRPRKKPQSKG